MWSIRGCGEKTGDHPYAYTCGMGVMWDFSGNSQAVYCKECRQEAEMKEKIEKLEKEMWRLNQRQSDKVFKISEWIGLTKFVVLALAASQITLFILYFGG